MGAWSFIKPRFENLCGRRVGSQIAIFIIIIIIEIINLHYTLLQIIYSGRSSSSAPAVAIGKVHEQEAEHVITNPFKIIK